MENGNINSVLKLLTSNISNRTLPLDDKTLSPLKQNMKHWVSWTKKLRREKPSAYHIAFENIDENIVNEAALKTKSGSGPSGLDADEWRKIASKSYWTINPDLRRAFANIIEKIYTEKLPVDKIKDENTNRSVFGLQTYSLDKNPWLRPGKVVKVVKEDIKITAECLQL